MRLEDWLTPLRDVRLVDKQTVISLSVASFWDRKRLADERRYL